MSAKEINGYELSRKFWDFSFDNPEKVKPAHGAVYFFAIEHNNRLGWREKFGFPTEMAMSAVGIKNWRTYSGVLNDLEKWGFIEFLERSKNQYSANIISLFAYVKNTKATTKALDKAMQKHIQKQGTKQVRSTVVIDKHINLRTIEPITTNKGDSDFEKFWELYEKKTDRSKCEKKWDKIKREDKEKIFASIGEYVKSTPESQYRKNPLTWLNGECWNDEIVQAKIQKTLPTGFY